jgi:competence ComEA-like helix-hairpin-helix protein
VNTAAAGDIAEVLGLTAKEAEAIVKYRKDAARFEEFDDLGKVPGVDLKKLEKRREAISF